MIKAGIVPNPKDQAVIGFQVRPCLISPQVTGIAFIRDDDREEAAETLDKGVICGIVGCTGSLCSIISRSGRCPIPAIAIVVVIGIDERIDPLIDSKGGGVKYEGIRSIRHKFRMIATN